MYIIIIIIIIYFENVHFSTAKLGTDTFAPNQVPPHISKNRPLGMQTKQFHVIPNTPMSSYSCPDLSSPPPQTFCKLDTQSSTLLRSRCPIPSQSSMPHHISNTVNTKKDIYICIHISRVVSGSRDATLRMWDIDTGHCVHVLIGHIAAVRCVQYDGHRVVSGAYDYQVKIWDPETETCLQNLSGHTNRVYSLQVRFFQIK